jgi:hypothetical protein
MRLETQLDIIDQAIPGLVEPVVTKRARANRFVGKGRDDCRNALEALLPIPYLRPRAEQILRTAPFQGRGDEFFIPDEYALVELKSQLGQLSQRLAVLRDALSEAIERSDDFTIAVMLPESDNLREIAAYIATIEQVFSKVISGYRKDPNMGFRLVGFDTGSLWLRVTTLTTSCMILIAAVTTASGNIARSYVEWRQSMAYTRAIEADAELRERALKFFKDLGDLQVKEHAKRINQEHYDSAPEQEASLREAITDMTHLILMGVDIKPPRPSPLNEAAHFPDLREVSGILKPKALPAAKVAKTRR